MIIAVISAIITVLYFALYLYLYKGLKISSGIKGNENSFPFISVIIAARNESENIGRCIKSLKGINYPSDKFEIIFVNDDSTDDTESIIKESIKDRNNFFIINADKDKSGKLKGKINALNSGISKSRGDIILMTDADCIVNKNWLRHHAKYYTRDVAMVCGFTLVAPDGFFGKVQSVDWMYLLGLASASSGINSQLSCIGNNLSISKKIYNEIGGYEGIKYSVTEDLTLMQAVQKLNKGRIIFPLFPENYVTTAPCKDFSDLMRQKKRWLRGGFGINILGYIIGILMYLINIIFLAGYLFLPFGIYLLLVAVKFLSDWMIVFPVAKNFGLKDLLIYFPVFEVYYMAYALSLPFTFITGKSINWKDRNL